MKNLFIILIATILIVSQPIAAREAGYKGSFDVKYAYSYSDGTSNFDSSIATLQFSDQIMLTTTHGYQFNPYLFVGGGIGLSIWYESDEYDASYIVGDILILKKKRKTLSVPIYADVKLYPFSDLPLSPYLDVQIGYTVGDVKGFYFNPEIGVRFGLNDRLGFNFGIGYQLQKITFWAPYKDNSLTFKLGFDF